MSFSVQFLQNLKGASFYDGLANTIETFRKVFTSV